MKCNECGCTMMKVDRRTEIADMCEDVTDGQMADYLAAESSGDMGSWSTAIVEYKCNRCKTTLEVIADDLKDLNILIKRWHEKARMGDYFEKYVFEYLAFNVFLKVHVAISASRDRRAIETLKGDSELKRSYINMVNSEQEPLLNDAWQKVILELNRQPLRNSSRDYDHPEPDGYWTRSDGSGTESNDCQKGIVHSLTDWENMVEYWYAVRNNLFHGGKDPTIKRDIFLVKHAFITLNAFMRMVIGSSN